MVVIGLAGALVENRGCGEGDDTNVEHDGNVQVYNIRVWG